MILGIITKRLLNWPCNLFHVSGPCYDPQSGNVQNQCEATVLVVQMQPFHAAMENTLIKVERKEMKALTVNLTSTQF